MTTHTTLEFYPRDYRVRRQQTPLPGSPSARRGGGPRGAVTGLSAAAARNLQFEARNLEGLTTLLHLTYPAVFPRDGEVVKRHWARLREWLTDQGVGGLWLLEFQARGAPHFMLFLNGRVDRDAVAARWDRIVGSGDPEHRGTGTRVERTRKPYAAAAYAVKFCEKHAQKQVPPDYRSVGRMWGTFGGVRVRPHETLEG
ncbi:MAG TPA: hypothetical protein VK689_20905, partial [Armatimonadota bacterium]|nr:hypothetical protein [Armatimonadota bacterium]